MLSNLEVDDETLDYIGLEYVDCSSIRKFMLLS